MSYLAAALILAAFGCVLLIGEYFFATHGILLVAAIICFFAAVGVVGVYGSTFELATAAVMCAIAVPLSTYGAVVMWKRVFGGNPSPAAEASIAEMPELVGLIELRGRVGKTLSELRPSGVVEFEDRRVDVMTEGLMIEKGVWVKCVDVKPGKVIVRPVEVGEQVAKKATEAASAPISTPTSAPTPNRVDESGNKKDLNNDDWQIG
jgi:membrane-bound ClpP family serine protease